MWGKNTYLAAATDSRFRGEIRVLTPHTLFLPCVVNNAYAKPAITPPPLFFWPSSKR